MVRRRVLGTLVAAAITAALAAPPLTVAPARAWTRPAPPPAGVPGLVCDGQVHVGNIDALQRAMTAGATVTLPSGTCVISEGAGQDGIRLPGHVTVQGAPSGTRLVLANAGDPSVYRHLFVVTGDHVALTGLQMDATPAFNVEVIQVDDSTGFSIRRSVIDGGVTSRAQLDQYDDNGIDLSPGPDPRLGGILAMTLDDVTITRTGFGLYMADSATGLVSGLSVADSLLQQNYFDDLEFNAPHGQMTRVTVQRDTFDDNRYVYEPARDVGGPGAGFAVGLAHVQGVRIAGNTFSTYSYEPLHLENGTQQVVVTGNTFSNSFTNTDTNYAADVTIVGATTGQVSFRGNGFDTGGNRNTQFACVLVGPSGPAAITLDGNRFALRSGASGSAGTSGDAPYQNYGPAGNVAFASDNVVTYPYQA